MAPLSASDTPTKDLEEGINQLTAVGRLLDNPSLARVYVYVCYYGPVTRPEIKATLDIPKTTVYDHVATLEELGVVTLTGDRPVTVTADPVLVEGTGLAVTPTILHAVGMQESDDDIAYFVDRHGMGKLTAAVRQAGLHYASQVTQRMTADPLDITAGEAIAIVQALKPILAAGHRYDPYFDRLFPDVATDIEFEEDLDVAAPGSQTDS